MTLQTLVYIKGMLEREAETREKAYKKLAERLEEAEYKAEVQWNTPDSEVNDNIRALRGMRRTQRKKLREVKDALGDFMGKDWN